MLSKNGIAFVLIPDMGDLEILCKYPKGLNE